MVQFAGFDHDEEALLNDLIRRFDETGFQLSELIRVEKTTRPGYDGLIQAMGGVMSLTGLPDGEPQKVGIPVADLFAGLYGCIGILAALRHRDATGQGQQIDIGMLDTHCAWLANQFR